jgi:catechol 2,3-dioxygenase-like lactoylglutathione lyase family enzyme
MSSMQPRIFAITLGVDDLERALTFYREGLGLPTQGIIGTEFAGSTTEPAGAVVMFQLQGGLTLSLYPRGELAKDAELPVSAPSPTDFSIGYLAASRDDVDALLAKAEAAGATRTGPSHERPWGIYAGYFRDPDGHLWEVLWGPQFQVAEP